jgi:hypothetical protein
MKTLFPSICVFGLATALTAQSQQGDFVATAYANSFSKTNGGLFVVSALAGTVTDLKATGNLTNSYSIATDPYDDSILWVGTRRPSNTATPAIYKVVSVAGKILSTTKLGVTLTAADHTVLQVRVWGHRLLFLTTTQLSSIPLTGGKTTVVMKFDTNTGAPFNFACDGRNVYVNMQPTVTLLAEHILHIDLEAPQFRTVIYQTGGITHFIPSLTINPDGNLLITESEAFSGVSHLKQMDAKGKVLRTFKLPFTHGVAGARMDSSGTIIVVAGKTYDTANQRIVSGFLTLLSWKIFKTQFGTSPEQYTHVDIRGHIPLNRYGHVCQSATKWRPEIAAVGLPQIGNTNYKLYVKGIPGANAMLLVGAHGAMPIPFPLSIMGAGTCELGVQPLISLPVKLTNTGDLLLPASIPASASTGNIDIQWLIAEAGANRARFVSSQIGSIVIR